MTGPTEQDREACPNPDCRSTDPTQCCAGEHNHPIRLTRLPLAAGGLEWSKARYCCSDGFHTQPTAHPEPQGEQDVHERAAKRWTIRVCENHRVSGCALCSVFDVIQVVEATDLTTANQQLEDAERRLTGCREQRERWLAINDPEQHLLGLEGELAAANQQIEELTEQLEKVARHFLIGSDHAS